MADNSEEELKALQQHLAQLAVRLFNTTTKRSTFSNNTRKATFTVTGRVLG
jgi:hypothetical protein